MNTAEYMPMFLAEAHEHVQQLNLAVVRLENDPSDRPTVDEIFRIAHSIKGMSATMGFVQIAALTHEMEDVFELLRQRQDGISHEAVDTLLACVDALSAAIGAIELTGAEELDPEPLVQRLRGLVWKRSPEQRAHAPLAPDLEAIVLAGERVLQVVATLSDEVLMPAVRAHMAFAALAEHGELVASDPALTEIDQFQGREVRAWLVCEHEEQAVAAAVSAVSEIVATEVTDLSAGAPDREPEPGPEPAVAALEVVEPVAQTEPSEADDEPVVAEHEPAVADHEPAATDHEPAVANHEPVVADAEAPLALKPAAATRTVRVDAERLDAMMHSMGELVIHRTAVQELTAGLDVPELQQAVQELARSSQALQAMVMQVRMIPVEIVFLRLPRLVRDLASRFGKEVKLELVGSDTELDRTVVDALGDPLVHLVRNALDHGLEPTDERVAAGKPAVGTVQVSARHAGTSVIVEVRDDGRGVDTATVARKALALGLIDAETVVQVDDHAATELLFTPGFSTADATTDVSGRGVGMDAVRARIRELGGEVVLESEPGRGTLAQIRLPLTLAIVAGLHVDICGDPYAIPLDRIERTLLLTDQIVRVAMGRRMLLLDDGVLPLLEAGDAFGRRTDQPHGFAVILRGNDRRIALAVDGLVGQRELVTRPLPPVVADAEPVSGAAALADGRIALIVDCDRLDAADSGARRPTRPLSSPSEIPPPSALGQLAA